MRKNIYWLLLVGLIAASCGSSSKDQKGSLNDKKAELQKLKDEQKTSMTRSLQRKPKLQSWIRVRQKALTQSLSA
jgi:hypothetical protein